MINKVLENLIFVRFCQLLINDKIKNKEFKIPIHLAFGHEAIATSIAMNFAKNDNIILTHRNIHYNLAISNDFKSILNEFRLKNSGLAKGRLGSMNLCSPKDGIVYSSSILGNSLPVAAGVALSTKLKNTTFVVTGDGAMEEGSFYETIVFGNSIDLSMIIIVENNNWSMYTPIKKRRKKIDLKKFSKSLGVNYFLLDTNNVFDYTKNIKKIKNFSIKNKKICIVEVILKTLGDWEIKEPDIKKRVINYHHGGAPEISSEDSIIIKKNRWDPIFRIFLPKLKNKISNYHKKLYYLKEL